MYRDASCVASFKLDRGFRKRSPDAVSGNRFIDLRYRFAAIRGTRFCINRASSIYVHIICRLMCPVKETNRKPNVFTVFYTGASIIQFIRFVSIRDKHSKAVCVRREVLLSQNGPRYGLALFYFRRERSWAAPTFDHTFIARTRPPFSMSRELRRIESVPCAGSRNEFVDDEHHPSFIRFTVAERRSSLQIADRTLKSRAVNRLIESADLRL